MTQKTITRDGTKLPVYRAKTQFARAKLARKLLRESKDLHTVTDVVDTTGLCFATVARFMALKGVRGGTWEPTRLPRHETVRSIFEAFGIEMLYAAKGEVKGVVEV